jgi:hypothetical protein
VKILKVNDEAIRLIYGGKVYRLREEMHIPLILVFFLVLGVLFGVIVAPFAMWVW